MGRQPESELQRTVAWASDQAVTLLRPLIPAMQPVMPYILQAAVSLGAYSAGLAAAQVLGSALRISCATPIAAPIGGFIGVGFASALAGQASLKFEQVRREGYQRAVLDPGALLRGVRREVLLTDAALGAVAFKCMGGRFRSVMPSDLTKVGAIARESLPATNGQQYATEEARAELRRFFRRDGCHHCGTRKGKTIGDHMPPNKHVQIEIERAKSTARKLLNRTLRAFQVPPQLKRLLGGSGAAAGKGRHPAAPKQRFYPQCDSCSLKQSQAVRANRSHLVYHKVLHQGGKSSSWHYAGPLVGLRHAESAAALEEDEQRNKRWW